MLHRHTGVEVGSEEGCDGRRPEGERRERVGTQGGRGVAPFALLRANKVVRD